MNVASAKTLLKRYAGQDDSDPLLEYLNAGRHMWLDADDWPFLEVRTESLSTAVGSNTVAVPADLFKVVWLRDRTTKELIEYKTSAEFYDEISDPSQEGKPSCFTLTGMTGIRFWPVPDAVLSLDLLYQKQASDLANDADLLDPVPTRYHMGVVFAAASVALQAESEEDRAQSALAQFQASVDAARSRYNMKQAGETGHVHDSMGYFVD